MKNKTLFQKYMTGLGEIFDKKISDVLKNIYWEALKPFSDEQCKQAFDKVFVTAKFFPKPADLVEAIGQGKPKIEDKALIIAHRIITNIERKGCKNFPDLSDDPIAKHLMTTRWPYYYWAEQVLESELKWWIKEFCEAYRVYSETGVPLQIEAPESIKKLTEGIGNYE